MSNAAEITQMLGAVKSGDRAASDRLMEAIYSDLRGIAHRVFSGERPDHTLQPTALVHEAWLRLFEGAEPDFKDRAHFYAVAARQMRRLLMDHGREFRAQKRGGGLKVSLDDNLHGSVGGELDFEDVNDLLDRLQRTDAEAAQVVELKFFAGMTDQEVAEEIGCSHSNVRRHWKFAQAWLISRLTTVPAAVKGNAEKS